MFAALRARQPGRSLVRILWWSFLRMFCWLWMVICYRIKSFGVANVPRSGAVLYVSNHQSYLDPIVIGVGCAHRQFCSMARATLFNHSLFSLHIQSLNAIPVNQDTPGKSTMRKCLEKLNSGQVLLIFPEGARTLDGRTQPFAPGTMLFIKRGKPQIVPVAIAGGFHAWPRGRPRPKLFGRIGVQFGEPITSQVLIEMGPHAAMQHLRDRVETMRLELATNLNSSKQRD